MAAGDGTVSDFSQDDFFLQSARPVIRLIWPGLPGFAELSLVGGCDREVDGVHGPGFERHVVAQGEHGDEAVPAGSAVQAARAANARSGKRERVTETSCGGDLVVCVWGKLVGSGSTAQRRR